MLTLDSSLSKRPGTVLVVEPSPLSYVRLAQVSKMIDETNVAGSDGGVWRDAETARRLKDAVMARGMAHLPSHQKSTSAAVFYVNNTINGVGWPMGQVAMSDHEVVGALAATLLQGKDPREFSLEFEELVVAVSARGKGVASAMLQELAKSVVARVAAQGPGPCKISARVRLRSRMSLLMGWRLIDLLHRYGAVKNVSIHEEWVDG